MTACLRPKVVGKTINSFNKRLVDISLQTCRLYLNIDPMPEGGAKAADVINACKAIFGEVVVRTPNSANFATAIKWVWSQSDKPYLFHLEDDWKLKKPISVVEIINILDTQPKIQMIRLTKLLHPTATELYGLSPCVVRNSFCKTVAANLSEQKNPEKQLLSVADWGLPAPSSVTVKPYPANKIVIKDIGRDWRRKNKMSKPKDEIDFLNWQKRNKIIR